MTLPTKIGPHLRKCLICGSVGFFFCQTSVVWKLGQVVDLSWPFVTGSFNCLWKVLQQCTLCLVPILSGEKHYSWFTFTLENPNAVPSKQKCAVVSNIFDIIISNRMKLWTHPHPHVHTHTHTHTQGRCVVKQMLCPQSSKNLNAQQTSVISCRRLSKHVCSQHRINRRETIQHKWSPLVPPSIAWCGDKFACKQDGTELHAVSHI